MENKTFKSITRNGKRYNLLTLPGTNYFRFEIINKQGASIERVVEQKIGKNVYGISHLIEHLSFKSSKDYTTEEIINIKKNEGQGNAGTSFDQISYWFETTMDKKENAIKFVSNVALNDLKNVTQSEFDIEKRVVFNEAKRYHDDDQTIFYFNSLSRVMGYKEEDNVIGFPATIETFTLKDAQDIKNIFLDNDESVYNVVYDNEITSEDEIIKKIEQELCRFKGESNSSLKITIDEYTEGLSSPKNGTFIIKNEADQAMTTIIIDAVHNILLSNAVCEYLGLMADNTSLTHIIREKNGLTYGLSFYPITLSYKSYIAFGCDVTKGTEEKMVKLFKESICTSYDNWTKEKYDKFMKAMKLKRTLSLLDQATYINWFKIADKEPKTVEKYKDILNKNINDVYVTIDQELISYKNMKNAIKEIRDAIENNRYSKVVNTEV